MTLPASFERTVVRVPYRVDALKRGAKRSKTIVCMDDLAVGLRVVSGGDLETAVVATVAGDDGPRSVRYAGFEGSLWLPLADDGVSVPAEVVLERLAAGASSLATGLRNPFLATGHIPYLRADLMNALPIEESLVRQVVDQDRNEVMARATRLAGDIVLAPDGTVWRKSPGPFLLARPDGPVSVVDPGFDLPTRPPVETSGSRSSGGEASRGSGAYFGAARVAEALEHAALEYGRGGEGLAGSVEILRADCLPDHDALIAARAAADSECAGWIRTASLLASDELVAGGREAIAAAARIHDVPAAVFGQRHVGARTPLGGPVPGAEALADAVDRVRGFFSDVLSAVGTEARQDMNRNWRGYFEERRGDEYRRFDVYERDRLALEATGPDLDFGPDLGFAPAAGPRP